MKKRYILSGLIAFCLFCSCAAFAQQPRWERRIRIAEASTNLPQVMSVDAEDNIYVGLSSINQTTNPNVWVIQLVKFSKTGSKIWEKNFDRTNGSLSFQGQDTPMAIAIDAEGNVILVGISEDSGGTHDFLTLKYAPDGTLLWSRIFEQDAVSASTSNTHGTPNAVAVDADNNIYVTGSGTANLLAFTAFDPCVTVKYSPEGILLWVRHHKGGTTEGVGKDIQVDSDGNILVYGNIIGGSSGALEHHTELIKYDASGNELWVSRVPVIEKWNHALMTLAPDNSITIAGTSFSQVTNKRKVHVMRFAPDGNRLWHFEYDKQGAFLEQARGITSDAAGNVYVTMNSVLENSGRHVAIKLNAQGEQVWQHVVTDTESAIMEHSDLILGQDGLLYAFLSSSPAKVLVLSTNGQQKTLLTYNGSGSLEYRSHFLRLNKKNQVIISSHVLRGSMGEYIDGFVTLFGAPQTGEPTEPGSGAGTQLAVVPNPVQSAASIRFNLLKPATVKLMLYNSAGQELRAINLGQLNAGLHSEPVKTEGLASGKYYIRVAMNEQLLQTAFLVLH